MIVLHKFCSLHSLCLVDMKMMVSPPSIAILPKHLKSYEITFLYLSCLHSNPEKIEAARFDLEKCDRSKSQTKFYHKKSGGLKLGHSTNITSTNNQQAPHHIAHRTVVNNVKYKLNEKKKHHRVSTTYYQDKKFKKHRATQNSSKTDKMTKQHKHQLRFKIR